MALNTRELPAASAHPLGKQLFPCDRPSLPAGSGLNSLLTSSRSSWGIEEVGGQGRAGGDGGVVCEKQHNHHKHKQCGFQSLQQRPTRLTGGRLHSEDSQAQHFSLQTRTLLVKSATMSNFVTTFSCMCVSPLPFRCLMVFR